MPCVLLPASAAAFAPRSPPTVVLNTKVDPWLTATLKRVNRIKRPLNSVPQHFRCLTDTLAAPSAIWTLCSIMLPKAPEAELRRDENPLVEALFNYQLLHIDAYVVHVDMVLHNEVAFKLTPDAIEALVDYHKHIYALDIAANTWQWPDKEAHVAKLHEDFVQAANRFVYRTHATALEGLEDDGAGELLAGRSDDVRTAIMALFLPLLPPPPPPPRIVDVVRPAPLLLPSSPGVGNWWQQQQPSLPPLQSHPLPLDSWKVLPSSPSNASSSADSHNTGAGGMWAGMGVNEIQLPSPTPSYSQPYTTAGWYTTPSFAIAPVIPQLPLPSILAQQQCGTGAGFGGFGWDRYNDFAPIGAIM